MGRRDREPEDLFAAVLAPGPRSRFVTFYDECGDVDAVAPDSAAVGFAGAPRTAPATT